MDNNFNNQGEYHNYSQQPPQGGYPQPQDYPTPPYYDPNSQGDPNQPNSGLAIASMVLGICGVVFGCCTYYLGFLLGIIGIQCQQLKRYWHLPCIKNQIEYLGQNTLR